MATYISCLKAEINVALYQYRSQMNHTSNVVYPIDQAFVIKAGFFISNIYKQSSDMINEEIQQESSHYQLLSSQEILVEFCQEEKELVGSIITSANIITGQFGSSQMFPIAKDKVILLDTATNKVKVVDNIYRSIILRRQRKKCDKKKEGNQIPQGPQDEVEGQPSQKSEKMFESSSEIIQKESKKKKKIRHRCPRPQNEKMTKTRLFGKLRTLSKKAPPVK